MKKMYTYFKIVIIGLGVALFAVSCSDSGSKPVQSMQVAGKDIKLDGGCIIKYLSPANAINDSADLIENEDKRNYSLSLSEIVLYSRPIKKVDKYMKDTLVEGVDSIIVGYNYDSVFTSTDTLIDSTAIKIPFMYFTGAGNMIRLRLISHNPSGISPGEYTFDANAEIEDGFYPNTITSQSSVYLDIDFDKSKVDSDVKIVGGFVTIVSISAENNEIELEFELTCIDGEGNEFGVLGQYGGEGVLVNEYQKLVERGVYNY